MYFEENWSHIGVITAKPIELSNQLNRTRPTTLGRVKRFQETTQQNPHPTKIKGGMRFTIFW